MSRPRPPPHYGFMAAPLPAAGPDPDPDFADLIAARPHLSAHAFDGLTVEEVPLARIAEAVGERDSTATAVVGMLNFGSRPATRLKAA